VCAGDKSVEVGWNVFMKSHEYSDKEFGIDPVGEFVCGGGMGG
jgi:hypothetical protein